MASRQEILGLELERTTKGFHYMNSIYNPLAFVDENTVVDFHANHHNFIPGEKKGLPFRNTRHADDNFVRENHTYKPVEDDLREELKDFSFCNGAQQSCKPSTTTNMNMRSLVSGKENVESGSRRSIFSFNSSKINASKARPKSSAGLLGLTDAKRLQEQYEVSNKPLSQLEMNVLDEAGGGLDLSSGSIAGGLPAALLEGSQNLHSQEKHSSCNLEECSKPRHLSVLVQERIHETSWGSQSTESLKAPLFSDIESMEAPLLSEFQDQSENGILCGKGRQDNPKTATALLSQSKAQCMERGSCDSLEWSMLSQSECNQDLQTREELNRDHVVIVFSVQKFLQENAARVNRHKLSKLSSLCALYSHKILCWVTSVCREQNFTNCLQRIRRLFSSSARGFVDVNSQKLPETSTMMSSPSSQKKLAKDNELRAVLLKINEVLASMETSS